MGAERHDLRGRGGTGEPSRGHARADEHGDVKRGRERHQRHRRDHDVVRQISNDAAPTRIASPSPRANTPYGESATIQWSRTEMDASTARNRSISGSRSVRGMRLAPMANAIENTSTGTIAPSAAARTALDGTSATIHCAAGTEAAAVPAAGTLARSEAAAAGSIGMRANTAGMMAEVSAAAAVSNPRKRAPAPPPSRPRAGPSSWPAMLTMSFATTSGRIVIRIALIHSVPTASATTPARARPGRPEAAIAMPVARPAIKADQRPGSHVHALAVSPCCTLEG